MFTFWLKYDVITFVLRSHPAFFFFFNCGVSWKCQNVIFRVQLCQLWNWLFFVCVCVCAPVYVWRITYLHWFNWWNLYVLVLWQILLLRSCDACWKVSHVTFNVVRQQQRVDLGGENGKLKPKNMTCLHQIHRFIEFRILSTSLTCLGSFWLQIEDCQNKARHQNRFHRAVRGLCRLWFVLQRLQSSECLLVACWRCERTLLNKASTALSPQQWRQWMKEPSGKYTIVNFMEV